MAAEVSGLDKTAAKTKHSKFSSLESVKYEWKSNRYAFQQAVARLLAKPELVETACFVVVGSDAFVRSTIETLLEAGVAKEHIILDKSAAQRKSYLPAS